MSSMGKFRAERGRKEKLNKIEKRSKQKKERHKDICVTRKTSDLSAKSLLSIFFILTKITRQLSNFHSFS